MAELDINLLDICNDSTKQLKKPYNLSHFENLFYKWCNCERTISEIKDIRVKCYDSALEAINAYEIEQINLQYKQYKYYNFKIESKLIPVFKYFPQFIQEYTIQNYFKSNIIFENLNKNIIYEESETEL